FVVAEECAFALAGDRHAAFLLPNFHERTSEDPPSEVEAHAGPTEFDMRMDSNPNVRAAGLSADHSSLREQVRRLVIDMVDCRLAIVAVIFVRVERKECADQDRNDQNYRSAHRVPPWLACWLWE